MTMRQPSANRPRSRAPPINAAWPSTLVANASSCPCGERPYRVGQYPALAISRSSVRPRRTDSRPSSVAGSSERSARSCGRKCAGRACSASRARTICSPAARCRAAAITSAPRAASPRLVSRPMPRLPPVTSARRPSIRVGGQTGFARACPHNERSIRGRARTEGWRVTRSAKSMGSVRVTISRRVAGGYAREHAIRTVGGRSASIRRVGQIGSEPSGLRALDWLARSAA